MTLRYWIFVCGVLALTGLIGYNTYTSARLLRRWRPDRNLLLLPTENLLRLVLIVLCVGLGALSGLDGHQLGWVLPQASAPIVWGFVWGCVLAIFFYASTRWVIQHTGDRFYSPIIVQAIVPRQPRELWLVCLVMTSVVLLEELLFRSLLLGGLAPILTTPSLIIGWGLLFGLLHSPQGLWGIAGATLAGIILGWLFVQQGTLLTPLIAHYIANVVQVAMAMRLREQANEKNS
jgi:membrane protease YdiL (CAAX protease family)